MNKGDIVIIKASAGQPGVRRIWDPEPSEPFVCHEEYWARWERHEVAPVCWPMSRDRLFHFDADLEEKLEAAFQAFRSGQGDGVARLEGLWMQAKPAS